MDISIKVTYKSEGLQKLRKAAGLSQSQLADLAGIKVQVLQQYERGARDINGAKLPTLLKICNALECRLADIITDEETGRPFSFITEGNTMGQHWSHLTPTKRIQLDAFIRAGMKPTDIAKELGVHHTTIYRELKRCTYEHLNSDYTTETRYNPEGAQARYEANLRAKGPELKIGNDYELADYLIAKIRDEKYSPEAAIGEAEVKGWPFKTHICASTAYNYIRGEIFGDELTVSMLPQHGKRHQPERPAGSMPRKPAGRSIEERPEHINNRSTFGHWEMDSVESCQGVSNTYIVMTERKTRWELIIPSPDKTAASVVAAIDGLEAKYGDLFPKVFRSITCDNGCEFADAAGIERSASGKGARTEVYYCHPYRPSERGSNENQNGLIRRHVPKGTDLSTISDEETKRIEAWLNNYPRKMFGYLCSEQLFREEMALILAS
jgi:IS30 family transposase/DNA-binding Xre family transcriptional regulator